jgi:hypothetical protein
MKNLPKCEHCSDTRLINDQSCGWCIRSRMAAAVPSVPGVKFAGIGTAVMHGDECVATARSRTMAARIAHALNSYIPNRRGL